jgi:hypothetical protein
LVAALTSVEYAPTAPRFKPAILPQSQDPLTVETGQAPPLEILGTIVRIKLLEQSGAPSAAALTDPERPQLAPLALGPFLLARELAYALAPID